MVEALVFNFDLQERVHNCKEEPKQLAITFDSI